jgi:hypothetical protein
MTNNIDTPTSITNILSEKIRHEETLINSRLTWMLTFQGFLFATVALVADDSKDPKFRAALLDVIPLVGAIVAMLTFFGVLAAYIAIGQARNPYREVLKTSEEIGFGGQNLAKWLGRTNSLGITLVVVIAWISLYFKLQ